MAQTQLRSHQFGDGEVKRDDLNTATTGQAVIRKIVQGTGVSLSSTGADAGTGDVTIDASTPPVVATALTDGATITWIMTANRAHQQAYVTLGGNRTFTWSGLANGMQGNILFIQDGTGGRTITFSAPGGFTIKRRGGSITLSTGIGAHDIVSFAVIQNVIYLTSGAFS